MTEILVVANETLGGRRLRVPLTRMKGLTNRTSDKIIAARAQGPSFDVAVGFGTNYDKSNNAGIDNANSENAFGSCTPGTGTGA